VFNIRTIHAGGDDTGFVWAHEYAMPIRNLGNKR